MQQRLRADTLVKQSAYNRTQVEELEQQLCRQLTRRRTSCMQRVFELGVENGQKLVWCSW